MPDNTDNTVYFKEIELENIGPINQLKVEFSFNENKNPKPMILVGENGSGKSIVLAHLVNSMISAKQTVFEDSEVEKGQVYKLRSPSYIQSGKQFSFASIYYLSDIYVKEWQLATNRSDFENYFKYTSIRKEWKSIPSDQHTHLDANIKGDSSSVKQLVKKQCNLYFPANRFEEPAWLNYENLTAKANYSDLKHIAGYSNRNLICTSPLKSNQNWLLDLLFDFFVLDNKTNIVIYDAIIKVLKVIFQETGDLRFGIGDRRSRKVSVIKNEEKWVPNIFQLPSGETQLLNLFLSIIKDFDLSESEFDNLSDIEGIVVIDEIDTHLHTTHQKEVLPKLIALFPKVQFIITTHSPLFLMGMEQELGESSFDICNLPHGNRISPFDFSEFISAYNTFKETTKFREDIKRELENLSKPIVFVEGDYDIRYLQKAADFLGYNDLIKHINFKDSGGSGNLENIEDGAKQLDKIWKSYDKNISHIIPGKLILIYDCDVEKQDKENTKGKVYRHIIPSIAENPINKGIENLFPESTIKKIEDAKPECIDVTKTMKRERGLDQEVSVSKSVNKDEKKNLCDWLCKHGTKEDFANFQRVFEIIKNCIDD